MIHDMHPREIPEIMLIEQSSYEDPWPAELFEKSFDNGLFCRVIRVPQYRIIIGYSITSVHDDQFAHIHNITIHPNWRRLGFAKSLLKDILGKPMIEFRLEVNPKNEPAIAFYKKYNFEYCKTIPAYYDNGDDAFLMINSHGRGVSNGNT